MGYRKLSVGLRRALPVIVLVGWLAACAPDRDKQDELPVCPGDPRCES